MAKEVENPKALNEILRDRKLYLGNLVKLIRGNYNVLTKVEKLSISAIDAEVHRIGRQLQRRK